MLHLAVLSAGLSLFVLSVSLLDPAAAATLHGCGRCRGGVGQYAARARPNQRRRQWPKAGAFDYYKSNRTRLD